MATNFQGPGTEFYDLSLVKLSSSQLVTGSWNHSHSVASHNQSAETKFPHQPVAGGRLKDKELVII